MNPAERNEPSPTPWSSRVNAGQMYILDANGAAIAGLPSSTHVRANGAMMLNAADLVDALGGLLAEWEQLRAQTPITTNIAVLAGGHGQPEPQEVQRAREVLRRALRDDE